MRTRRAAGAARKRGVFAGPALFLIYDPFPQALSIVRRLGRDYMESVVREGIEKRRQWLPTPRSEVVIGSFAKMSKINRKVIRAWTEIMSRVPGAKLLLKDRYFVDATYREM